MLNDTNQGPDNLIGAREDIELLSKKDMARLLVISDCHGHTSIMENIVRQFGKECDALIFCGDGAGDLISLITSAEKDKELRKLIPGVIAFARGNGDPAMYPASENSLVKLPDTQILKVNNQNIMIVHGHREGVDFGLENLALEMQLSDCKTAFYGHTHIAREDRLDDYRIINPGSCGRPRGGQPNSFAIVTIGRNFVDTGYLKLSTDLDGNKCYSHWMPIY